MTHLANFKMYDWIWLKPTWIPWVFTFMPDLTILKNTFFVACWQHHVRLRTKFHLLGSNIETSTGSVLNVSTSSSTSRSIWWPNDSQDEDRNFHLWCWPCSGYCCRLCVVEPLLCYTWFSRINQWRPTLSYCVFMWKTRAAEHMWHMQKKYPCRNVFWETSELRSFCGVAHKPQHFKLHPLLLSNKSCAPWPTFAP